MRRVSLFLFLACFLGSLVLVSCGQPKEEKKNAQRKKTRSLTQRTKFVKPAAVAQGFVGSEACRQCHAEIMKEYESHPMSISMASTNKYSIENYPTKIPVDAGDGKTWTAIQDDGQVYHSEEVKESDGTLLFDSKEPIHFTCGSGTRGCSYFVFDSGRLYQSPLTWYSEKKKWDLSPGYQREYHPRFERTASDGCMACHAGRMNPVENERSRFNAEKPFHEMAIGCERCHGPGKDHIDFHESSKQKTAKDPIVNPDKLSPTLREAVCYQCHLQGEQRVVRYGRSEFDFRPGMHISDVWITFLKSGDTAGGKVQAVSQVEQMHLSECFKQSKGEMGCISCHDPHRSPNAENRIAFYRERCVTCHQSTNDQTECSLALDERKKQSPKDSCIQCHMPELDAGDVAHTAQTDHRVHVPGDNFQYQLESENGFRIWNDDKVPTYAIERAKTIAQAEKAFLSSNPTLAEKAMEGLRIFHPPAEDDLLLNEALAQLYSARGDDRDAFKIWSNLLKKYPNDEFLLNQVSMALHEGGKLKDAYPLYKRLFKVNNRRPQVLMRHLDICTKLSKLNEGFEVALRIIELEPGAKLAHQWLAKAYALKNDTEKQLFHQEMFRKIQGTGKK